jgi:hypothetical protein
LNILHLEIVVGYKLNIFPIISRLDKQTKTAPTGAKLIGKAGVGTGPRGVGAAGSYDSFVILF